MVSAAFQKALLMTVLLQLYIAHPISEGRVIPRPLLSDLPCVSGPLGMESGAIPDSSITASSSLGSSYLPSKARPNSGGYAWIPRTPESQWIQVDLGDYTAITGVTMKGHSGGNNYVRTFTVQYSNNGESDDWRRMANSEGKTVELNGNNGSGETVTVTFPVTLIARFIRITPTTWVNHYRVNLEVLGCRDTLIRLVNGDDLVSGRVEIFHDEAWGAICDDGWDMKEATIVCYQLGFPEAQEATTVSLEEGDGEVPIVMNRVSCKGTERRLADCPFLCTSSENQCNSSHVAGVVCKPNVDIRLVGGSNPTSGRVEIYQDYTWGTLCDNEWDTTDADIVCRQLGFSGAQEAKSGAHFGQGSGPMYMDGVACDGSESKITNCPSFCWEEIKCNHTQDAGVICREGGTESTTYTPSDIESVWLHFPGPPF